MIRADYPGGSTTQELWVVGEYTELPDQGDRNIREVIDTLPPKPYQVHLASLLRTQDLWNVRY